MNAVCRDIFRAVYEGKWLSIEYRNQQEQVTRYWIGIRNIRPYQRTLEVDGLHLGCCAMNISAAFILILFYLRRLLRDRTVR